jgi:Peptidase M1 N-terminal domain
VRPACQAAAIVVGMQRMTIGRRQSRTRGAGWAILLAGALASCAGRTQPAATVATATTGAPNTTSPGAPALVAAPAPPALRLPDDVVPIEYALELAVDPAQEKIKGAVTIAVEIKRPTRFIWLHGKRLSIEGATVAPGATGTAPLPAGTRVLTATPSLIGEFLGLALPEELPIPDFPGAMENAGLITYGAGGFLAKPSGESTGFQ